MYGHDDGVYERRRSSPSPPPPRAASSGSAGYRAPHPSIRRPEDTSYEVADRCWPGTANNRSASSHGTAEGSSRPSSYYNDGAAGAPYSSTAPASKGSTSTAQYPGRLIAPYPYARRGSLGQRGELSSQPGSPHRHYAYAEPSLASASHASLPSQTDFNRARGVAAQMHDRPAQRWANELGPPPPPLSQPTRGRSQTLHVHSPRAWTGFEEDSSSAPMAHHRRRSPNADAWPPLLQSHPLLREEGEPRKYELSFRQQPQHGRMFGFRNKDRRPLDPLPIIELVIRDNTGQIDHVAHTSPDLLMQVSLISDVWGGDELVSSSSNPNTALPRSRLLEGKLTSSGHTVKDVEGERVCLFLFPDLSVRVEATVRLHFSLIRLGGPQWTPGGNQPAGRVVAEITSAPFPIHDARTFPGLSESTELAKCLAAQGVAVPIRNQVRPGPAGDS